MKYALIIFTLTGCQSDRLFKCETELDLVRDELIECQNTVMPELEFGVEPCNCERPN